MVVTIKNIFSHIGEKVTIKGWLHNKRSSRAIMFFEVRDGTGFLQAIVNKPYVTEEIWQQAEQLTQESSLSISGKVVEHPKEPGVFELQVTDITIISQAEEFPIAKKDHGPDFLLDNRHLWIRSLRQWAILRIRDAVQRAIQEYLHELGFVRTDTPIFTPNACEGTTTLFRLPYFDLGEAYLSQTGQLYLEALIASVGRCYDFGPVFRAEKSKTKRHLTEFWMMDAEAAFVQHAENMTIQEGLVKYIVTTCLSQCTEEFRILKRDPAPLFRVVEKPFLRYTYDEAIEKLHTLGSDIVHGEDLGNDDESLLTTESDVPIFIEKWPKQIKPFYMPDPENTGYVLNNDLIAIEGAGEIIGGSERISQLSELIRRINEDHLPQKEYEWYLDLRRYGSVPHSGFGMGLERMVRWISGVLHIRECIPFPRTITRLRP